MNGGHPGWAPLVDHRAEWPMASQPAPGRLRVVLRSVRGQVAAAGVVWADRYAWQADDPASADQPAAFSGEAGGSRHRERPCEYAGRDAHWDYWEAELELASGRFAYWFWVRPAGEGPWQAASAFRPAPLRRSGLWWVGEGGVAPVRRAVWPFEWPHALAAEGPQVPEWARGAVFYQIFVDRFCNGDPSNDPPGALPWPPRATEPVPKGPHVFFGGDLAGIIQKLPYLADLGVDAIYLTPVFRSPTNHKYDTDDYLEVDPAFGTAETLAQLTRQAHRHGIRVLLDLVFNHSGDRFFAFRDLLARGADSPYRDWYFPRGVPVMQHPPNYETFADAIPSMPKLNTAHPEVRRYLVGVARHWLERADVDGFRLDVANEVARVLWRELMEAARAVKPDVFVVGEVWHRAASWLRGEAFHSVMNYPWRAAVLDFLARDAVGPTAFWERLESLRFSYAPPATEALVNLIGSHDTPRFRTLAGGQTWRLKLALVLLFAYPGVAQVYYGDEVAMEGGPDPDCRRPMDWAPGPEGEAVRQLVRALGRARRQHPSLRTGRLKLAALDDVAAALAFWRILPGRDACLAVINRGEHPWDLRQEDLLDAAGPDSLPRGPWNFWLVASTLAGPPAGPAAPLVQGGPIHVPPRSGLLLALNPPQGGEVRAVAS